MTERKQNKQWLVAIALALFVHLLFFVFLVYFLWPEDRVVVVSLTPLPGELVDLQNAQSFEASLRFSHALDDVELSGARLYRLDEDGRPQETYTAKRDLEHDRVLVFSELREEGRYLFYVSDIDGEFLKAPLFLDGEFNGSFPSGDKKAGGAFEASFEIKQQKKEVVSARFYDPKKPEVNEEEASFAPAARQQIKSEKSPPKIIKKPKPAVARRKPKPEAAKVPSSAVVPSKIDTPKPQEGERASLQDLYVSPLNLHSSLAMQAGKQADAIFEKHDSSPYAEAAKTQKRQFESAYGGHGPSIRPGHEGNALNHIKEVSEYIALMHQEIHPQWGSGYLIRLDTIYRSRDARINDSDLEVKVEIVMSPYGQVEDVRMVRSTGITTFDSEALAVAWRSSPGLETPLAMRSKNGKSYIHWTFWRDGRQCGVFGVKVFKLEGVTRSQIDFNLKAVQAIEEKLGFKSSRPNQTSDTSNDASEPLPERIDPMDD